MNKKDQTELKKHFQKSDDLMVLKKIMTCFIDSEKTRKCQSVRTFAQIPDEELSVLYDIFAKVLKGTLGKGLVEYAFPNEVYEEDQSQNLLWELLQKGMQDEEQTEKFITHVTNNMLYDLPYAFFVGEFVYTVFEKDKSDRKNKYDSHEYHFLIGAVCPVESRVDGLIYDEEENTIIRKITMDRVVADAPTDGFLFPTFTGRGPDVNHVMYYAKKSKNPNTSIIEDVLGCKFILSADKEKELFRAVLDQAVGEDLNLQVIASVNEKIQDYAKAFKDEPEPPVVSDILVRDMLLDSGVTQEKAEAAQKLYRETVEDHYFMASNLAESKTTLNADGVTVNISGDATDKITTRMIDGRKFLMISLDSPDVTVNGFQMKIQ